METATFFFRNVCTNLPKKCTMCYTRWPRRMMIKLRSFRSWRKDWPHAYVSEELRGFEKAHLMTRTEYKTSDSKNEWKICISFCCTKQRKTMRMREVALFAIPLFRVRRAVFCVSSFHVSGHISWPPSSTDFTRASSSGITFIAN